MNGLGEEFLSDTTLTLDQDGDFRAGHLANTVECLPDASRLADDPEPFLHGLSVHRTPSHARPMGSAISVADVQSVTLTRTYSPFAKSSLSNTAILFVSVRPDN